MVTERHQLNPEGTAWKGTHPDFSSGTAFLRDCLHRCKDHEEKVTQQWCLDIIPGGLDWR